MGLLDRALARVGYERKAAAPRPGALLPNVGNYSGAAIGYGGPIGFPGWNVLQAPTDEQRARVALQNSWVSSAIGIIARELGVPNVQVHLEGGDGEPAEQTNHPFVKLWKRPNRFMGANYLAQQWVHQLYLFGEAYLFMAPAGNQLAEIWPIPSMWMRPDPDPEKFIKGFLFQKERTKEPIPIPAEYVCYSRKPHPFDPHRGLSELSATFAAVETDSSQVRWNKNFFAKKNAKISSIISLPADLNNADFERAKLELYDFYGGDQQQAMIARAGTVDVKALGLPHKDMDFLAGRILSREEIFLGFGIGPGYYEKNANEANARIAQENMMRSVIWPTLESWGEDLTAQILPFWYGENLIATFEDIRPKDRELQIREAEGRQKYWSTNEIRAEEGKEPFKDPEEHPGLWDDAPALAALDVYALIGNQRVQAFGAKQATAAGGAAGMGTQPRLLVRPNINAAAGLGGSDVSGGMPGQAGADVAVGKAADLRRWQDKALKALKSGRSAAVRFETDALDEAERAGIALALSGAVTPDDVRAAFKSAEPPAPMPNQIGAHVTVVKIGELTPA